MGKAKKRNFHKSITADKTSSIGSLSAAFTRKDAIEKAITSIKSNNCGNETKDIITLFGITAEELAEAGATYEELLTLKAILKLTN